MCTTRMQLSTTLLAKPTLVCCMIFPLLYSLGLGLGVHSVLGVEMKTLSVNALNSEPVNSYREVLAKKMLAMLGAPPPRRDLELVD